MSFNKVSPHSNEAEMAVLGAMLIEKDSIETVAEIIQDKHFYSDANRKIFQAVTELYGRSQPADMVTVTEELKRQGRLEEVGGQKYLSDLMEKVSTPAHTAAYAQIIKKKAILRDLIRISTSVIEKSYASEEEVSDILDFAQERVIDVSQKSTDHGFVKADALVPEVQERIERFYSEHKSVTGVPTGLAKLDEMTGGLQKGDLVILGARPSQGKTALALNIVYNAAVDNKVPTAVFSLEMGRHSIMERMVCASARANLSGVRKGFFKREVWTDLTRALSAISASPVWIDDTPGMDIMDLRTRTRKLQSQLMSQGKELGLVVIDYLQLLRGRGRQESRQQEVSEISRMLKDLARSLNVPVLALSQLNRRNESSGRTDNRPQLSDLRESGSLEQDADVVGLIHREYYYTKDEAVRNKAELILAKQRNGPVGDIELNYFPEYTRFDNPALPGTEPIAEEVAL
ncbi:MAG: replicative DNA helicase [Elusimicrobiota bacterium]